MMKKTWNRISLWVLRLTALATSIAGILLRQFWKG